MPVSKAWALAMREAHIKSVLKASAQKIQVYGPKKEEVSGEMKISQNQLCHLYKSPHIARIVKSKMDCVCS
jgi:hypothetical protein